MIRGGSDVFLTFYQSIIFVKNTASRSIGNMKREPKDSRSLKELVEVVQRGAQPEYVFFWGHTQKTPGMIDESCLSNWFPAMAALNDAEYPTTEHYMMAEKARLFGDEKMRGLILRAESPAAAKGLGRKVAGFDENVWKNHRFEIVVTGNEGKFLQNEKLGEFLMSTGSRVLVEASPRDHIWGIGLGKKTRKLKTHWNGED